MHDRDGAKPGTRLTSCGICLQEFPAATARESALLAKAHVAAGCPKERKRPDVADLGDVKPHWEQPWFDEPSVDLWENAPKEPLGATEGSPAVSQDPDDEEGALWG